MFYFLVHCSDDLLVYNHISPKYRIDNPGYRGFITTHNFIFIISAAKDWIKKSIDKVVIIVFIILVYKREQQKR